MNTAAKVAERKRLHPEEFCPRPHCLWRTDGAWCPRHAGLGRRVHPSAEDQRADQRLSEWKDGGRVGRP